MIHLILPILVVIGYTFAGMVCDFESGECSWSFESPALKFPHDPRSNFKLIVGTRESKPSHFAYFNASREREEPAMIISPYYQHLSMQCELRFMYRLFGESGAAIAVTTQHRTLNEADRYTDTYDYEDDSDWTRPTLHSTFNVQHNYIDSWKEVGVHIGHVSHPTRIRIECHSPAGKNPTAARTNTECYVDNIELLKCDEEIWYENVCQSNRSRKYLCHRFGHRKCIDYDQLCDMHVDCPGGEDEDSELHNCTSVPLGGRCTFEEIGSGLSDVGCPGWSIETYYVHNGKRVDGEEHLLMCLNATAATKYASPKHIPLRDHTFEHINSSGHFLFFTSEKEAELNAFTDTKTTYFFSPHFPPTNPILYDPSASEFATCKVRFYYCSYGSAISTLQLIVQPLNGQPAKIIWTPPSTSSFGDQSYYCEWMKVSVDLPEQKGEYYLKMSVSKIFDSSISFAIDDFSMTPNCFTGENAWRSQYIPYVYNISSCGQTGNRLPTSMDCEKFYNHSNTHAMLFNNRSDGFQKWLAPKTTEYRIEAYGGSGGQLPNQAVNNYGGRVITLVNLTTAMELEILVGQQGESPCDSLNDDAKDIINSHQHEALKFVCMEGESDWNDEMAMANAVMFPGTGGGGATIVKHLGRVLLVAGGGGGVFPQRIIDVEKSGISAKGGFSYEDYGRRTIDNTIPLGEAMWMSGNGASLAADRVHDFGACEHCYLMAGHLTNTSSAGGECPVVSVWKLPGGYGGGGASCGPGGGGGAGYYGGEGGRKYHGSGGRSFAANKNSFVDAGVHAGDGYVLIYPCRLRCSANATCRFRMNNAEDVVPFCSCANGREVNEGEDCIWAFDSSVSLIVAPRNEMIFLIAVIVFILFILALLVMFGGFCVHFQRRLKKAKMEKAELSREIGLSALTPTTPMNISGNPIYEPFGVCADLQHIPRHTVTLNKPLGQGAFGEVYEGTLACGNVLERVAVKTLPKSASKQAINDFEMEALIMSKFQHENICEFKGVCFDVMPRLIVLELLAGGDLKSFLRECRPRNTNEHIIDMIDLFEMAKDVAKGCKFLADNRFIHRDIAARNCLLTKKEKGRIVKIADFGMARDIYRQDYYRKGGKAMLPVKWMPPEAFLDGIFTVKTDVWSFGVLLWEIFSLGYMPYPGRNNQEVMSLIVNGGRLEPPNGVPDQVYSLMLECWSTVDSDRPKFDDIIERIDAMIRDPLLRSSPLPNIVHRLSQPQIGMKSATPESPLSIVESMPQSTHSQATINTVVTSFSDTGFPSCDPMPTRGDGINFNVCSPYQPQSAEPFSTMNEMLPSASSDLLLDEHAWTSENIPSDNSTLTASSAEVANRFGKSLPSKSLKDEIAGSRRPVIEAEAPLTSTGSSEYANAMESETTSLLGRRYPPPPQTRLSGDQSLSLVKQSFGAPPKRPNDFPTTALFKNCLNQSQIL
uniref:Tyrosine-protein kinase receptor n=2 Tax=Parascaris TaxID=6254 RepID=A0A915CD76_PARUN